MTNLELFAEEATASIQIGTQACVLKGMALPLAEQLVLTIKQLARQSPFRHMTTPGGYQMSAALTNCGQLGWTTDNQGYQYTSMDPLTQQPWPPMPPAFLTLAQQAARLAGFEHYQPDSCLINCYPAGAKMSLHQDKNEMDFTQPIVSVSLGIAATFLWGGYKRTDPVLKFLLEHGDVMVWGGVDRLRYHGVNKIPIALHPLTGKQRINFTFRKAG